MYYYGNNGGCGCGQSYQTSYYPMNYCCGGNNTSTYAIILVLFILLVIVIGTRFSNQLKRIRKLIRF